MTFTIVNGTDIILSDRINEYADNDISLKEADCNYKGYDTKAKLAQCECKIASLNVDNKLDKNLLNESNHEEVNLVTQILIIWYLQ